MSYAVFFVLAISTVVITVAQISLRNTLAIATMEFITAAWIYKGEEY